MKITIKCRECEEDFTFEAPMSGILKWKDGMLIQKALPELSAELREVLISHVCPKCWDTMFPPEDEEDKGFWIDPAGGKHYDDDEDPAKMYE